MVVAITGMTLVFQLGIFKSFFAQTGTNLDSIELLFTTPKFYIILLCVIGVIVLLYHLMKLLSFFEKVKGIALNVWEGILTLKHGRIATSQRKSFTAPQQLTERSNSLFIYLVFQIMNKDSILISIILLLNLKDFLKTSLQPLYLK